MTHIDFAAHLAAISRKVVVETVEGMELRTVVIRQPYPTTVEDLWGACTTSERLARGSCRSLATWRWVDSTSSRGMPEALSRNVVRQSSCGRRGNSRIGCPGWNCGSLRLGTVPCWSFATFLR